MKLLLIYSQKMLFHTLISTSIDTVLMLYIYSYHSYKKMILNFRSAYLLEN